MSKLLPPSPCLYWASILYNQLFIEHDQIVSLWGQKFSHLIFFQPTYSPLKTYYSKEMGNESDLERIIILSHEKSNRELFVDLKLWSNCIEQQYLNGLNRTINIDIGQLSLENNLLATGKPYGHRIFLAKGVYAELTYVYQNKSYQVLPWTYPDYQHEEKIKFFNEARSKLF